VFDDPLRTTTPARAVTTGGIKSHLVSVARDGGTAFSMNLLTHTVTKLAPHDATIAPLAVTPGIQPEGNCLSADETTLFVTNRGSKSVAKLDTKKFVVTKVVPVRSDDPTRIYLAGANRLFVTHFNGRALSLLDADSLCETAHIHLEARPAAAYIDRDGGKAYVSLESNESLEIDLDTATVLARHPTGTEPDACLTMPRRLG
jgi:DNA-binding beta-propeller fold protein YncE